MKCEAPKRMGPGNTLWKHEELRNEQDMPTHGQSHCYSILDLQPEQPCHAQLNPDIFALKFLCQQTWHKMTCWAVAGVRGTATNSCSSAALGIYLSNSISDANLWLLSWEQWKLLPHPAPLNETFAFLMPHTGYHKAYFYKFRSSYDVHHDTEIHRLCSPGSRQCCWSAVLNPGTRTLNSSAIHYAKCSGSKTFYTLMSK